MDPDVYALAMQSFIRVLTHRLVEKGVFSREEMSDLHDAWFGDLIAVGAALEGSGQKPNLDDMLQMIHVMGLEFAS